MTIRMLSDNVLIRLEPAPTETASGIAIVHNRAPGARENRTAIVLSVGPGHYDGCKSCGGPCGSFVPTTLVAGERIIVDAMAGHKWDLDVSAVRARDATEFGELLGERGEYRVIREAEALAVLGDDAKAAE